MASLQAVPGFSTMSVGTRIQRLDGAVTLSNLGRGARLFSPGDFADQVFFLQSGRVKIGVSGPGGKNCLFHVVEAGEIFGEAALLGERIRSSSAEVLERASVVMAPVKEALAYARKRPEFWTELAPLLADRMRNLEEQIQWVSFLEVEQRIARLMLRWAEDHSSDGEMQEFRLSQRDLAGMIGATRETTSSALNRLQREGCIRLRRRCVTVESTDGLRRHVGRLSGARALSDNGSGATALARAQMSGD